LDDDGFGDDINEGDDFVEIGLDSGHPMRMKMKKNQQLPQLKRPHLLLQPKREEMMLPRRMEPLMLKLQTRVEPLIEQRKLHKIRPNQMMVLANQMKVIKNQQVMLKKVMPKRQEELMEMLIRKMIKKEVTQQRKKEEMTLPRRMEPKTEIKRKKVETRKMEMTTQKMVMMMVQMPLKLRDLQLINGDLKLNQSLISNKKKRSITLQILNTTWMTMLLKMKNLIKNTTIP